MLSWISSLDFLAKFNFRADLSRYDVRGNARALHIEFLVALRFWPRVMFSDKQKLAFQMANYAAISIGFLLSPNRSLSFGEPANGSRLVPWQLDWDTWLHRIRGRQANRIRTFHSLRRCADFRRMSASHVEIGSWGLILPTVIESVCDSVTCLSLT